MIQLLQAAGIAKLDHQAVEDALIHHLQTLQAIFGHINPKDGSPLAGVCAEALPFLNHLELALREIKDGTADSKPVRRSRRKASKASPP